MNIDSGEAKLHFLDYWRVLRVRMPLIILVFLLVVITASVVTYLMPRQYGSTVTMQLRQNDTYVKVFDQTGGFQGLDPRFITTQFEIIQRKEMLYPVIESLNLVQKWGVPSKEIAYYRLRGMLNMREIRNTELIQISVFSTDKKEAAEIANTIAEEYQRRRISEQQEWVSKSLSTLDEEVQKQKLRVQELKAVAAKIRVEKDISDLNPEGLEESSMSLEGSGLLNIDQQVNSEELRVAALRAKHDQVSRMTDDQLMNATMTLDIADPIIQQVLPLFKEAGSEEARLLNSGLGSNHPTVKSLRAKKDVMEKQLSLIHI